MNLALAALESCSSLVPALGGSAARGLLSRQQRMPPCVALTYCCAAPRPPAVDKADESWQFSTGFICEEMIRARLFPSGPSTICCLCGPPPMIKFACLPNLEKIGYTSEQCIQF